MALTIGVLTTTVTLAGQGRETRAHDPGGAETPSMDYAMPSTQTVAQDEAVPAQTATRGKGAASKRKPVAPNAADPSKVADRVYELMKQEVALGKMRGGWQGYARKRY